MVSEQHLFVSFLLFFSLVFYMKCLLTQSFMILVDDC